MLLYFFYRILVQYYKKRTIKIDEVTIQTEVAEVIKGKYGIRCTAVKHNISCTTLQDKVKAARTLADDAIGDGLNFPRNSLKCHSR